MPEVISVGEPLAEFVAQEAGPLGEVVRFRSGWGGDTWNFMVAAAKHGASTGYVSRVGADDFGTSFLKLCRAGGIDASHVKVDGDRFTGLYLITFDHNHENYFTYYRNGSAASVLSPEDVDEAYVRRAQLIHTSGITQAISESARAAADRAIAVARDAGILVSYDANIRPKLRPARDLQDVFLDTIERCDIVFLSEQDASIIYGDAEPRAVTGAVLEAGAQLVVFKAGERGCLLATADGITAAIEAVPIERRDASGAGDAFAGAFVVEWLHGADPPVAARHANAAGALTAAAFGAVSAIPGREEVLHLLARQTGPDDLRRQGTESRETQALGGDRDA